MTHTIDRSIQAIASCDQASEHHILRIRFTEADQERCYELPKRPPSGLTSTRFTQILDDFLYALQARQWQLSAECLYVTPDERQAHAAWFNAHALALETDAKLARTLARGLFKPQQRH